MAVANPRHYGCPRVLRCVVAVCAVAAAYDFDDPHAAHTSQAIQWDRENRRGDSRRARPRHWRQGACQAAVPAAAGGGCSGVQQSVAGEEHEHEGAAARTQRHGNGLGQPD